MLLSSEAIAKLALETKIIKFGHKWSFAIASSIILLFAMTQTPPSLEEEIDTVFHSISEGAAYLGTSATFGAASLVARLGWALCLPWNKTAANEYLLLGQLCSSAAHRSFSQVFKYSLPTTTPPSHSSWHLNRALLSQIPALSQEEKNLLSFLENRWLAKSTGFFPLMVNWVCPSFGISVQVHPETTNGYARSPSLGLSQTYVNRVRDWKQMLPHPKQFPLVLTRPFNLQKYLSSYLKVDPNEPVQITVERLSLKLQKTEGKVVVDLTDVFPQREKDQKVYQAQFFESCRKYCLERELQNSILQFLQKR